MNRTYFKHRPGKFNIDDLTFTDLNMDQVFSKIDNTVSSLGEEILYSYLRIPALNEEEIKNREESISLYASDESDRILSKRALSEISKLKKISVFEYLFHLDDVKPLGTFEKFKALIFLIIAICIVPFSPIIGILAVVAVYFYNAFRYFKLKNAVSPFYICLSYISKAVKCGKKVPAVDKNRLSRISFLENSSILLGSLSGETTHGGSGNPLDILIDLVKMGFHIDIIRFYSLISKVNRNRQDIEDYLTELGSIDAAISIFELRQLAECTSKPVFGSDNDIHIEGAIHPLIKDCVPNDISTNKSVLLTGSNASGKSTFLRTVAINMVLAQGINTTFSASYKAPFFRIISAMSVTDDVMKGDSFYMAEIKALKRILDHLNEEVKVCAFVDEVLNGTNTVERIAASSRIMKYIADKAMCFGATHDLELTSILNDNYVNYHFSEDISSEDIHFSYKLLEGPSNSTNAIKLLEMLDYPKAVTGEATEAVKNYLNSQMW